MVYVRGGAALRFALFRLFALYLFEYSLSSLSATMTKTATPIELFYHNSIEQTLRVCVCVCVLCTYTPFFSHLGAYMFITNKNLF